MPVNMEHGPGKMFFSTDNGLSWELLGETTGGVVEYVEPEQPPTITNYSGYFEVTADMLGDCDKSVRELLHPSLEKHDAFIRRLLQSISHNRRVTHLIMYARKDRVRKKNLHRYQRLLALEIVKEE